MLSPVSNPPLVLLRCGMALIMEAQPLTNAGRFPFASAIRIVVRGPPSDQDLYRPHHALDTIQHHGLPVVALEGARMVNEKMPVAVGHAYEAAAALVRLLGLHHALILDEDTGEPVVAAHQFTNAEASRVDAWVTAPEDGDQGEASIRIDAGRVSVEVPYRS